MFCNRPDKKGVSRSDPADTFFSAENAKTGRPAETAQTPRKEKKTITYPA